MQFNAEKWNEWYLPKKELIDKAVNSISHFTNLNENLLITEDFNPLKSVNDLVIFLYFKLNIVEYTIYEPGVNKVGFVYLKIDEKTSKYFPYIERAE
jgi:hypothetical protein